jgi:hypothetical protein
VLIAVPDHLTQARACRSQVLLKLLDMIGEWPELGQLVFELSLDLREFGDPLGQFPVADLVELMSELLPHRARNRIMTGSSSGVSSRRRHSALGYLAPAEYEQQLITSRTLSLVA